MTGRWQDAGVSNRWRVLEPVKQKRVNGPFVPRKAAAGHVADITCEPGPLRMGLTEKVHDVGHMGVHPVCPQFVVDVCVVAVTELKVARQPVPDDIVGKHTDVRPIPGDVYPG